ncbi:MAG: glycine cleavage system protein GcvH [Bacteroidetes bacterium]|nr:glycine cleavage system protein GcvH [Bacteroidota bacterium]
MTFPDDRRYTTDHEWIRLGDDGLAAIGVTDYAQGELGDIVFVELKPEGADVGPDEVFGTVEAVKTVSELFAPVAGTIEAINEALEDAPETVNSDPYGEGWMVKIRPANPDDIDALMTADEYKRMVGAEA